MENRTPDVTPEKSPDEIERDMERTRDSITEKVAALENQVLGTIQTATSTVTDTVQAVKDAVTTAPAAVKDTVKETVAAVKESIGSFSVRECVRDNPWAALGTTTAAGFLLGYLLPGGRGGLFGRPIMARGEDVPAEGGRAGTAHDNTPHNGTASPRIAPSYAAVSREPEGHGLFGDLFGMIGREVRQIAEQAVHTGLATLKQSVQTQVPQMVDSAVHTVTDRVSGLVGAGECEARVGGPDYRAAPPPTGV